MSDIHGQHEKFKKMLKKIQFKDTDKLYIIGDVIDRGDTPELLKTIWSYDNIEVLCGNHEDMAKKSLLRNKVSSDWACNDGDKTYEQVVRAGLLDQMKKWIRSLKVVKIIKDKKIILVHAGFGPNSFWCEDIQEAISAEGNDLLWNRPRGQFFNANTFGYTVICGHTPTININGVYEDGARIVKVNNSYVIDCGACYEKYGGRLACLRLDDFAEFYI